MQNSSAAAYLPRVVDSELDDLLGELAAVALEGPKGVGKTATARRRAATIIELDDPARRAIAEADPRHLLTAATPVLLDEWQNVPSLWDAVRRSIDRNPEPNQFLFTGSSGPKTPPTHSGAGRIVSVRMRPLSLAERGIGPASISLAALLQGHRPQIEGSTDAALADYVREIVVSGFPGIRGFSGRALRAQLDGYLRRIVDRDFAAQGLLLRQPEALVRWMTAYAAATSTTASFESIRDASTGGLGDKPAKTTVQPYREILERLWIVDPVAAWLPSRNRLGRLAQPPKHHLADPALACRLLGVDEGGLIEGQQGSTTVTRDGMLLGRLFESLVTLSVRVFAQACEARVWHFRQHGGQREIDLIVERADQRVLALEIKLGAEVTDTDVRHLTWLHQQLGTELLDAAVIHTGHQAYRRRDGIAVIPAALLGP